MDFFCIQLRVWSLWRKICTSMLSLNNTFVFPLQKSADVRDWNNFFICRHWCYDNVSNADFGGSLWISRGMWNILRPAVFCVKHKRQPPRMRNEANAEEHKEQKLQFFECPLGAGSKRESIPIDSHVIMPNFTAEINMFTAWYGTSRVRVMP